MILILPNGSQIRGDNIVRSVLRSDLSPVPLTLEAEIRSTPELESALQEGGLLTVGGASGDVMRIVKSERHIQGAVQGDSLITLRKITAMLDACHKIAFVRSSAIIKENARLSVVYRASGATLREIGADYSIPRFTCPVGDVPSWHIARSLQEAGGIVRWKAGKLQFIRLLDLAKQKPVMTLSNNETDDIQSGFMERHEVPTFFSLNASGGFVMGNKVKARPYRFAPMADAMQLFNMTRCLIRRKVQRISYSGNIAAGDVIQYSGMPYPLTVITAAHVWESGTDGGGINEYTRLWLGAVET